MLFIFDTQRWRLVQARQNEGAFIERAAESNPHRHQLSFTEVDDEYMWWTLEMPHLWAGFTCSSD